MTRRSFALLPAAPLRRLPGQPARSRWTAEVFRLHLRHTWTTTMASSDFRDVLHVRLQRDGLTGHGEGAPIVRYREDALAARQMVEQARRLLEDADPLQFRKTMRLLFERFPGNFAAKAAIDIALHDWVAQRLHVPLYTLLGLDPTDAPLTSFSIGIDTPEITRQKVLEAEPFPILKIKVGLDKDQATMDAVRSLTQKTLRVDANEGFKSKEEAVRKIKWLETLGVELIEQPLPAHMVEETRWVRSRVNMPILADEACLHPEDIPRLAGAYDGIVVKLMKSGGILEVLRMIEVARAHKLKVMIGCMIESSIGITAAAHLSPLADWADLDGNLLINNDPWQGVQVHNGRLVLPRRPGLGLARRRESTSSRSAQAC